jgi:hypothetical protein
MTLFQALWGSIENSGDRYFITSAARLESATKEKRLFIKAYDEWERDRAIKEREYIKKGSRK